MWDISANNNAFGLTTFILYGPINTLNNLTAFVNVIEYVFFDLLNHNKICYKQ